jgi:hypothetical protein
LSAADMLYDRAKRLEVLPATVVVHDFGGFAWRSNRQFQPIDYLRLCDISLAHIAYSWPARQDLARRALLQSLFRERGPHPTLIYIPSGAFFSNLENSVDQIDAYFHLTAVNGFFLLISRGSLLHYHPPFETFLFRPVFDGKLERMRVLGFAARGLFSANQPIILQLGLLPQPLLRVVHSVTLKIAIHDAAQPSETAPKALFDGDQSLLRQWQSGEPLYLELPLSLPDTRGFEYSFSLGVRYDDGPWQWQELPAIPKGASFAASEEPLPRFPSGLPQPISPSLVALEAQLRQLWQRRQLESDLTIVDRPLATALAREGMQHDTKGENQDSYLSYVFAMQADPDATAALDRRVSALRDRLPNLDADFKRHIELLQRYYTDGSPATAQRLVAYLESRHHGALARYFAKRAHLSAVKP